jgi:4-coumarate--CoA ligase
MTVLNWDERQHSTTQAVGEPIPNCEVKLMDDAGINEVAAGERGELWVKCPQVMKGYWKKPEATRNTITPDGWVKTGDIAFQDKEGKYAIVDRKKVSYPRIYASRVTDVLQELIKVKGNQVAPAELEALLLEHPDVQDAAVIGIKV